jgi:hypothetical protein
LAFGVIAVMTIYASTIRTARQTKEEIALTLIQREIRTRTQLATLQAVDANGLSTFALSTWMLRDATIPDNAGEPTPLDAPASTPADSDLIALNGQNWTAIKSRFDEISPAATWDKQSLFSGFQFRMRTVWPSEVENNQFTDFDGYDVWDNATKKLSPNIYNDEIQNGNDALKSEHTPVQPPATARATPPKDAKNEGYFGPSRPSHGARYDPRGLRHYLKRVKCVIGWDLSKSSDIYSGQYVVFYFSVYNPDARKNQ